MAREARKMLWVVLRYEYFEMAIMTRVLPAIEKKMIGKMNREKTSFSHIWYSG